MNRLACRTSSLCADSFHLRHRHRFPFVFITAITRTLQLLLIQRAVFHPVVFTFTSEALGFTFVGTHRHHVTHRLAQMALYLRTQRYVVVRRTALATSGEKLRGHLLSLKLPKVKCPAQRSNSPQKKKISKRISTKNSRGSWDGGRTVTTPPKQQHPGCAQFPNLAGTTPVPVRPPVPKGYPNTFGPRPRSTPSREGTDFTPTARRLRLPVFHR